jgi:hypothetical protein
MKFTASLLLVSIVSPGALSMPMATEWGLQLLEKMQSAMGHTNSEGFIAQLPKAEAISGEKAVMANVAPAKEAAAGHDVAALAAQDLKQYQATHPDMYYEWPPDQLLFEEVRKAGHTGGLQSLKVSYDLRR